MSEFVYALIYAAGVFLASIAQVMLKKAAMKEHGSFLKEYLNPQVIFAYIIFLSTTFISIYALKGIPLSLSPILEATGYIYILIWGVVFFGEKVSRKKLLGLSLVIGGIIVYAVF